LTAQIEAIRLRKYGQARVAAGRGIGPEEAHRA